MLRKGILGIRPSTSATVASRLSCRTVLSRLSTLTNSAEAEGKSSPSTRFPPNPRMVFVRPWEALPTMAHVFSIVRDIEKTFGKIDDIIVPRDSDIPSNYGPYFIVKFAWEEDAQAIPPEGKVIQVPSPRVSENRQGGIGLSDLEPYLNSPTGLGNPQLADEDPKTADPDDPQVKLLDVKLERARLWRAPPILDYSPKHRKRKPFSDKRSDDAQNLALAIVNFGGFTNPALPPNAPPSSFARVVESWYNVMTPETRSKLANLEQEPQSAEQMLPQNSEIHNEINAAPFFSSQTHSSDPNDSIQESADETTLIPESSSVIMTPNASHAAEPSIRTSSAPISPHPSSNAQSRTPSNLAPSASSSSLSFSSKRSSPNTLGPGELTQKGEYNNTTDHSNPINTASEVQTPLLSSTQSTSSQPQFSSKMSRRERMLFAVKEAGKADAMRTKTEQETLLQPTDTASQPLDSAPPVSSKSDEPGSRPLPKASANWWGFLLGNEKPKQ